VPVIDEHQRAVPARHGFCNDAALDGDWPQKKKSVNGHAEFHEGVCCKHFRDEEAYHGNRVSRL
jgi:hypothetical protein